MPYKTYIPSSAIGGRRYNAKTTCRGCGKAFPCSKVGGHLPSEFYVHCIEQCPDYKALDLIRACDPCQLLFYSSKALDVHLRKCPAARRASTDANGEESDGLGSAKRSKQSDTTVANDTASSAPSQNGDFKSTNAVFPSKNFTTYLPNISKSVVFGDETQCKGCGKIFECMKKRNGATLHPPEFFIHCVENCTEYAQLGLIKSCDNCKLHFINEKYLFNHNNRVHLGQPKKQADFHAVESGSRQAKAKAATAIANKEPREKKRPSITITMNGTASATAPASSELSPASNSLTTTYRIYVPHKVSKIQSFPDKYYCKGCFKPLPTFVQTKRDKQKEYFSPNYYNHVVNDCVQYRELDLLRTCNLCKVIFDGQAAYDKHLKRNHVMKDHSK